MIYFFVHVDFIGHQPRNNQRKPTTEYVPVQGECSQALQRGRILEQQLGEGQLSHQIKPKKSKNCLFSGVLDVLLFSSNDVQSRTRVWNRADNWVFQCVAHNGIGKKALRRTKTGYPTRISGFIYILYGENLQKEIVHIFFLSLYSFCIGQSCTFSSCIAVRFKKLFADWGYNQCR